MRVAQHHHAWPLAIKDALQPIKVHLVEALTCALQPVVDYQSVVARNNVPERVINGLLDDHLVAWTREMVDGEGKAMDDATDETHLVGSEL